MKELEASFSSGSRILHVLSQRPSLTGSGITLDALVRLAGEAGLEHRVAVGVPAGGAHPEVGGLPARSIHPLPFAGADAGNVPELLFPVPGMSDVMPYRSSRWSSLTRGQVDEYCRAWRTHLSAIIDDFRPHLIHAHHVWLVSSLLKELAPATPVVAHCHGTGLRQMVLCPHLAERVRAGCRSLDRFLVLHQQHADDYGQALGLEADRFKVVGAGYREDLFHTGGRTDADAPVILYAGKLSRAKGLPWLLEAVASLSGEVPRLTLHVAGGGEGEEADTLRQHMELMSPLVVFHGRLDQQSLASLMRRSSLFVLPSFYEGLPLVLVEALASGCRLVATALPGVVRELAPQMGDRLSLVPLPRLRNADQPLEEDLPVFTAHLARSIRGALQAHRSDAPLAQEALRTFTWQSVYNRVEQTWDELTG
jgi:glycosyltransferase involved in cell wall biosynthesis